MLLGLCGPWTTRALAQHTVHVEGIVKDSVTGEALPAVAVMLKGTTIGTVTDNDGRFTLEAESAARTLSVSYLGYETYERPLTGTNRLTIRLQPTTYTLNDVVVRPGHERYSRRNQAVDFVRNVIERRELNAPRNLTTVRFSPKTTSRRLRSAARSVTAASTSSSTISTPRTSPESPSCRSTTRK